MKRNQNYPPRAPQYEDYPPDWDVQEAPDSAYLGDLAPVPATASRSAGCLSFLKWGALAAALLTVLLIIVGVGSVVVLAAGLPSTDQLATLNLEQSTKIYDRNGGLLYEIFDPNSASSGRRTVVPPEKIPLVLKQATIATEDPTFYTNPGVDWYAIARAIYYDVRYQRTVSGGSTITQQLARNTLITPEQTIQRKLREAILAVEITQRYSKDQILADYLNTIPYGNLSYGIEAASESYFGKHVEDLQLPEASLLAGLPQAPATYDPCDNPDAALTRQMVVLGLMQKQGFITADQATQASTQMTSYLNSDGFKNRCGSTLTLKSPHFVVFVLQDLEAKYGPEVVYKGGLQVYTSLDPTLQTIAEDEVKKQVAALQRNNVTDGAVVATNPQTGEIYAMVGSADFYNKNIDGQVNVATSLRQPGSSIKPINYVTAFEKGWTPATPLLDIVTQFPNGNQQPYIPTDYDLKEHGIVNIRTALDNSLNIPAVKTLYFVGVKDMIATAQKMGITSFTNPNQYGLALTLGGGEVKLVELTGAYAIFANSGKCVSAQGQCAPLTPYRKIVDGQGRVILDNTKNQPPTQQVLDPRYAYEITNILSDNNTRALEFGLNSPLKTSRPAFAKTGTTNDFKDNWTLGGTTELVVGVWVGNARGTAMKGVSGITGAAPIWHNVLERAYVEDDLLKGVAPHNFPIPAGLVQATVCNESGLLPTDLCPPDHRHTEIFLAEQAPKDPDNVWVKLKIDKTNNLLANDNCPADIVEERVFEKMPHDVGDVMPYDQVVAWANAHDIPQPPSQPSPCTNQSAPPPTAVSTNQVHIGSPHDGDTIRGNVRVTGSADVPNLDHFVVEFGQNNQWVQIGTGTNPVVHDTLAEGDTRAVPDGPYAIRLTVTDRNGQIYQDQVQVTIDNHVDQPTPTPTRQPTNTPPPNTGGGVGPGTYNFNSGAIAYSGGWTKTGSFARSNQAGATASLTVSGAQSVAITFIGGQNRGQANILLDGTVIDTVDTYSPGQSALRAGPYPLPDRGVHTITVQVTGVPHPGSNGTIVALNNLIVSGGAMALVMPTPSDTGDWALNLATRGRASILPSN